MKGYLTLNDSSENFVTARGRIFHTYTCVLRIIFVEKLRYDVYTTFVTKKTLSSMFFAF